MHKCCCLNILFSPRFLTLNNKATLTLTLALLALNVYVTRWDKEKCANAQCTVFKFCWTLQSCQLTNMDFPNQHGSDAVEEIRWFSCQEKMFFSPLLLLEAAVWSYQTSLTLCQAAQHANPWKHMSRWGLKRFFCRCLKSRYPVVSCDWRLWPVSGEAFLFVLHVYLTTFQEFFWLWGSKHVVSFHFGTHGTVDYTDSSKLLFL